MGAGQEKTEERYKRAERARNAYLFSLFSLLFCVLMLTGITYAWMTDTASSGNNRIIAGNLNLGVKYMEGSYDSSENQITVTDNEWKPIDELFYQNSGNGSENWEPGEVKAVALKVTNAGSVAAQYDVFLHISEELGGITNQNEEYVISKKLEFVMTEPFELSFSQDPPDLTDEIKLTEEKEKLFGSKVDSTAAAGKKDLNALWARIGGSAENGELRKESGTLFINEGKARSVSGVLKPGETRYINLLLYLPAGTASQAMDGSVSPYIRMGLYVVGTQTGEEADSFGAGYDKLQQEVKVAADSVAQKTNESAYAYSYAQAVEQEQTYTQTYMPQYATVNLVTLTAEAYNGLTVANPDAVPGFVSTTGSTGRVDVSVLEKDIQYSQEENGCYAGVPGLIFYRNIAAENEEAAGSSEETDAQELTGKQLQEAQEEECCRFSLQYPQEGLGTEESVLCYCFYVTGMQEGVDAPKTLRFYIGTGRTITGISCTDAEGNPEDLKDRFLYAKDSGILQFTSCSDGMCTLTILLKTTK